MVAVIWKDLVLNTFSTAKEINFIDIRARTQIWEIYNDVCWSLGNYV